MYSWLLSSLFGQDIGLRVPWPRSIPGEASQRPPAAATKLEWGSCGDRLQVAELDRLTVVRLSATGGVFKQCSDLGVERAVEIRSHVMVCKLVLDGGFHNHIRHAVVSEREPGIHRKKTVGTWRFSIRDLAPIVTLSLPSLSTLWQ